MKNSDMAGNSEEYAQILQELEWLEEDRVDGGLIFEKIKEKMKRNPLVPIGCIATTCALVMGLNNFVKGGSPRYSQLMMRWRVGLQAATFASIFIGAAYEKMRVKYK